jgi:hypothetical protein
LHIHSATGEKTCELTEQPLSKARGNLYRPEVMLMLEI